MPDRNAESGKNQVHVNDARRFIIIGVCVALLFSVFVCFCLFTDSTTSTTKKPSAAAKIEEVQVPAHFAVYADAIKLADKKIRENSWQMKESSKVALDNLHGFFSLPLRQTVSYQQIRVPGDPRDYRKGVHQGIDFYGTKTGDPINAAASGVVIRIDKAYRPLDKKMRDELLKLCATKWNGTPGSVGVPCVEEPYGNVLDKLSGRQVILYHGKNAINEPVISLYAHLSAVNQSLAQNDFVTTDTIIGYVGNSGTSGEANHQARSENHLHLELFVGGMYWTPKQASEIGHKQSNSRETELQKMVLQELSRL